MTLIQGQKFKPYEYKPYPKYVKLKDGTGKIVGSLNEHEALQNELLLAVPEPEIAVSNPLPATVETTPAVGTVTDKTALYEALEAAGVIYDKRWGAGKLQETLDAATKVITPVPVTPPSE